MDKDKAKQKAANRKAQAKVKAKGITKVLPEPGITTRVLPSIPGVRPLGIPPAVTGSICNSFETLPGDVQDSIDSLSRWCELKGIEDDRRARIDRAIHYQQ